MSADFEKLKQEQDIQYLASPGFNKDWHENKFDFQNIYLESMSKKSFNDFSAYIKYMEKRLAYFEEMNYEKAASSTISIYRELIPKFSSMATYQKISQNTQHIENKKVAPNKI